MANIVYPYDDDDWKEETFDLHVPSSRFGELQPFVDLWRSKMVDGKLPKWSDFQFEDFKDWYGWICVYNIVSHDPFDFVARLWGVESVELLGYDMTGKSPRLNHTPPYEFWGGYDQADMDFLEGLQQTVRIGLTDGCVFWQNRKHVRFRDVFLPLAKDGTTVDSFLAGTHKLPRDTEKP